MQYTQYVKNNRCIVEFFGKFTRRDVDTFNKVLSAIDDCSLDKDLSELCVDLTKLEYIDSSAIGVLQLIDSKAASLGIKVAIMNPQGQVRQVLMHLKLDHIYEIIDEPNNLPVD